MSYHWKCGLKKWFKRENLVVLILSGVLLFIVALPVRKQGETKGTADGQSVLTETASAALAEGAEGGADDYRGRLERELAGLLSKMSGMGRVEVMITLKNSEERVIGKDVEKARSDTAEEDSQGGSRSILQTDTKESTVYGTQGGGSQPYVVKTLYPAVEGVVVVAEGADTGRSNRDISDAVCALFGIEAHKVKVLKMEPQE